MSFPLTTKRVLDVDNDVAPEQYAAKKAIPDEEHPTHPFYLLEHLVRDVLPEKCRHEKVKAFYQEQLNDPESTIKECKSLLPDWILHMWDKGTLWKHEKLKRQAVTEYPRHGVIYMCLLLVEGQEFRYVGQSNDGHTRIVKQHENEGYRNSHPKFFYFLRERAEEAQWLILIENADLTKGPILNIMEHWMSLIFRSLQPPDLKEIFSLESIRWIPADEMHKGANAREPLAQHFNFAEFPMKGRPFRYSPISLKREWYEVHRNQEVVIRSESFLRGDIFEGSFWNAPGWHSNGNYEFQIWSVKLRVGKSWIDRCDINTIRIWCDLRPEGEIHEKGITRCSGVRREYNDPALRLGIRVSGIRNGDGLEGWCWLMMDDSADKGTPRLNRLVDWLEGRDTEELRPRRYYPANPRLGRKYCGYTLHPLDVGDKWSEIVGLDNQ